MFTLLADGREEPAAGPIVPPGETILGWERKPHGWCQDDACIPAFRAAAVETAGGVDLAAFARLLGRITVVDAAERLIAVGEPQRLEPDEAPGFTLDGFSLAQVRGRKVALVFWASWCGCRYDLAAWDELHRELEPAGFTVVSVSLDRDPADAAPWIEGLGHPALVDADGSIAELYNVVNVPTVVWVDEDGRIARPQDSMTATDTFREMNGLSSEAAKSALRRWVLDGDSGLTRQAVREHLRLPTEEERRARLHARLAAWLFRHGRMAPAREHARAAAELAPHDVAVRRSLMPLGGVDPFGEEYFRMRDELVAAGVPIYRPLPDWSQGADV
ncbi:hypothetical protein Pth03_41130 [Planotetraspora thailandica]|uniref:Thioredoxin domain-containing protein n=1 Tax=Planotetraspora thailandica TaxID=487172 RepID=A0A8J3V826_9ACTN|nr:TlpA disulfide reductase family protein [Planotetraspora thailandica]GII55724.1 hypothetical protein Pth03_41130 [Planotetraspora thailandica]